MPFTKETAAKNGAKGGRNNKSIRRFAATPSLAVEAANKAHKLHPDLARRAVGKRWSKKRGK